MAPGQALLNTLVGIPDFPGDHYAVTVSAIGPARMEEVMKCESCGYSITMGVPPITKTTPDWAALDKELMEIMDPLFGDAKPRVPANVILRLRALMRKVAGYQ